MLEEAYHVEATAALTLLGRLWLEKITYQLWNYAESLNDWLHHLDTHPSPDWRERFEAFIAEQEAAGFILSPESHADLVAYLESWAKRLIYPERKSSPPAVEQPQPRLRKMSHRPVDRQLSAERAAPHQVRNTAWHPPRKSPQYGRVVKSHWHIFHEKLREAEDRLKDIEHLLEPLGNKVHAAKSDDPVEVETDVDNIASLIYRHNEAMEKARQAWLDGDLGGELHERLVKARTPASLWLPLYADANQAKRAQDQWKEIGKRLNQKISFYDNLIFAMQVTETVGEVASLAIGAGFVVNAVKTGGKIALVKFVTQAAIVEGVSRAADTASRAVEDALLAAGVSEETISNIHTAAAVMEFVLELKRTGKALPSQSKGGVLAATSGPVPSPGKTSKATGILPQGTATTPPNIVTPPRKRRSGFKVDKHKNHPRPRPPETQSHHGVMSKWMKTHFPGYNKNEAPAILMSTDDHRKTFGVYNTWRDHMESQMGGHFDWKKITESDIRSLSEQMFDAANVPTKIRKQYWDWFARMTKALSK